MGQRKSPKPGSPASDVDPVTFYANEVTAGRIVAGPHVRDACARHLRDLKDGPARGLKWDLAEALESFRFYEDILRLNGGEFEGVPFHLHISQKFIVGSIFGWKRANGYRRFRVAYIEQGKGNGKSPLVAGIGLRMLVADGEPRAEVYAAATKKDQAQILFRDAVAMVDQSPDLDKDLQRSGGKGREWNIADPESGSFFRTVASDDAQSGPRPHCALLDEVHEHKTGLMVEMMRAGTKGRRQALIVMITNSGSDKQSVCWTYHEYGARVCSGMREDDAFFSYICALDESDDPMKDKSCWAKANPLLGVSIQPDYIEGQVREAEGMPGKEATVRRLNFCQWTEAVNPWLGPIVWAAARDTDFDDERLLGRKCYGGLDLSSTTDLTAFALLFEPTDEDPHWRQKVWFWLPEDGIVEKERKDKVEYIAWRASGWLETTPGSAIDKRFVLSRIVGCASRYDIQMIGFDRWRIEDFKALMADEGVELPLQDFGMGFQSMAPATDEYERLLISGELKHDGNPLMTWCAANVAVDTDPAGNRKPSKKRSTGRIDGIVGGVIAAGIAVGAKETVPEYQAFVL